MMIIGDLFLLEINYPGVTEEKKTKHLCERRDIIDEVLWVHDIFDVDFLGLFIGGGGEWSLFCDLL